MTKQLVWLVAWLMGGSAFAAGCPTAPSDTIAPDYDKAVDLCLFHRFTEAELLLKQIISRPDHPNREAARFLLMDDVYFGRNQYRSYLHFADSTGQSSANYAVAKFLIDQSVSHFGILSDSITISLRITGWPIANVFIDGRTYRFIVDTEAERTFISKRVAAELNLPNLFSNSAVNSLRQTISAIFHRIDTLQLGALTVTNLPVMQTSMAGFPADGLLGWDILGQFCFTIDYMKQCLILRKPVVRPSDASNLTGINRPMVAFYTETGNQLNVVDRLKHPNTYTHVLNRTIAVLFQLHFHDVR